MTGVRSNNFDALRITAAAAVVVSHAFPALSGSDMTEPLYRLSHGQTTLGHISVYIFFIVSGYLITQSWEHSRNLRSYLTARILRIYPALLVTALLCAFVMGPLVSSLGPAAYLATGEAHRYVVNTLLLYPQALALPGVFTDAPSASIVNAPLWTLRYEFSFYLVVAVLGATGLLKKWTGLTLLLLATALPLVLPLPYTLMVGLGFFKYFAAGMTLHAFQATVPLRVPLFAASVAVLGITLVCGYFSTAFAFAGAYAVFWLAFSRTIPHLDAARYGDLSYGTYIFGWPVQQLLITLSARHDLVGERGRALAITLALAYLSWHLVEKRSLRAKRYLVARRSSPKRPANL